MSFARSLYGIINARWVRHFLARRIRRISLPMARLLQYGRTDLNIKSYWDRLWSMGVAQELENERYAELTDKVIELVPSGSMVLDVGCGTGRLMKSLRERKQCTCIGLDISDVAIGMIRESGFRGYLSKLPNIHPEIRAMKFDVVTAVEVLEHIRRADEALEALKEVIKPGGKLIITVPNNCMGPEIVDEHEHKFTEDSIRELVTGYYEVETCNVVVSASDEYLLVIGRKFTED